MTAKRLVFGLWLAALSFGALSVGLSSDADHDLFAEVKTRADKGDAEAQLRLGDLYALGTGVKKDLTKAVKWHRKAAEQGLSQAQYRLGFDYANGDGVKLDKAEALRWFRRAADQGLVEAQVEMGLCYLNGKGTGENAAEAVTWFRKAVEQGDAYAGYELGKCYLDGAGVPRDTEEGVNWIRRSAERGFAAAENEMGECCERGIGMPKDFVQAYKWYVLAAAQDDERAADIRVSLARVQASMTKDEVTQAQHLARDFRPKQSLEPGVSNSPTGSAENPGQVTPQAANSPGVGVVNVKAEDEGCEVFVDGAFVGNLPTKLRLVEGAHVIEVKKPGFKDYRRELKVTGGSELTLRPILEKP